MPRGPGGHGPGGGPRGGMGGFGGGRRMPPPPPVRPMRPMVGMGRGCSRGCCMPYVLSVVGAISALTLGTAIGARTLRSKKQ